MSTDIDNKLPCSMLSVTQIEITIFVLECLVSEDTRHINCVTTAENEAFSMYGCEKSNVTSYRTACALLGTFGAAVD